MLIVSNNKFKDIDLYFEIKKVNLIPDYLQDKFKFPGKPWSKFFDKIV